MNRWTTRMRLSRSNGLAIYASTPNVSASPSEPGAAVKRITGGRDKLVVPNLPYGDRCRRALARASTVSSRARSGTRLRRRIGTPPVSLWGFISLADLQTLLPDHRFLAGIEHDAISDTDRLQGPVVAHIHDPGPRYPGGADMPLLPAEYSAVAFRILLHSHPCAFSELGHCTPHSHLPVPVI